MKVCIWTIYPNHYQAAFHDALRAAGVDLRVCYFGRYCANRLALGWVPPAQLPSGEFHLTTIRQAKAVIADFDERIQVNTGYYNAIYWQVIRYCRTHHMCWLHWSEASSGRLRGLLQRRCYGLLVKRFALGAFAIGAMAARDFRRWGIPDTMVAYLPYTTPFPVSTDSVRTASGRGAMTFVFCGTLCARKAIDVILTAMENVHRHYPGVRLRLVGNRALDRPTEQRLAALERRGVVRHVGAVAPETIDAEWRQGDVCLLPSRFDGWGVALAEGARNSLALIGSDRCGASEHLITAGESGYIVQAGDADALTDAMMRFAASPELATRCGAEARRLVEQTAGSVNARRFVQAVERWLAAK